MFVLEQEEYKKEGQGSTNRPIGPESESAKFDGCETLNKVLNGK